MEAENHQGMIVFSEQDVSPAQILKKALILSLILFDLVYHQRRNKLK